jgi:4a-hydroxytetrahydrobiopterin dehydratase
MLPLTESEITSALHDLPGWSVVEGMIAKTYVFKTYKDGLVFAVAVGNWADSLNHHPDIIIGYQKVTISLTTHDLGGIGPLDVDLAREIETLIPR